MSSSYRLELNKWLSDLDVKAGVVVDIGGSQERVKDRVKSWNVKKYVIADLPEPHKDSPKPDIEVDLNDIYLGDVCIADTLFCLEVFDYVWNSLNAMQIISALLRNGGVAWVTFPSIYPLHQPVEDDALRYMPAGIAKLAQAVGLTVEEMIPRHFETNLWDATIRAERMRAAKHQDHSISGWIVKFKK